MVDVSDNGKIADVCAVHEDGLTLHFSICEQEHIGLRLRISSPASILRSFPKGELMRRILSVLAVLCYTALCFAQPQAAPTTKDFIRVQSPVIALEHVRVIDGTGAPAKADQTIVISGGKITAIGNSGAVPVPADANRMDFTGYSALPGLVGMHDHLFYPAGGGLYHDMPFSFPAALSRVGRDHHPHHRQH